MDDPMNIIELDFWAEMAQIQAESIGWIPLDEGLFNTNLPNEDIAVKWEIATDKEFRDITQQGISLAVAVLWEWLRVGFTCLTAVQL